jgi:DNA-binding transcriptional regulator YhcF (GntR family)
MAQHSLVRPPARVVSRIVSDFLLRSVRIITQQVNGDLLGGIAVLALMQGRYAQCASEGPEAGSPRPVSVQSLARSLKTPAETMRRCAARLLALGWIERVPAKGVVICEAGRAGSELAGLMRDIRAEFWRMIADLKAIGFDFDLMDQASNALAPDVAEPSGLAPEPRPRDIRAIDPAIDRAILDFGLRIVDESTSPFSNDYVMTCILAAIVSANASTIAYDPEATWTYASESESPPEATRRAVTLAEISQMLGIPYETTRRYVNTLLTRGICVRDERKLLYIPMPLIDSPISQVTRANIVRRFVQVVTELKRLGVDFRAIATAA